METQTSPTAAKSFAAISKAQQHQQKQHKEASLSIRSKLMETPRGRAVLTSVLEKESSYAPETKFARTENLNPLRIQAFSITIQAAIGREMHGWQSATITMHGLA
jgi:hypothetical protein